MLRPMFVLTRSIAVFDEHTRLTRLEADATPILLAALGTAVARCIGTTIHPSMLLNNGRIHLGVGMAIPAGAFLYHTKLMDVELPALLMCNIGRNSFGSCVQLKRIRIPTNVISISWWKHISRLYLLQMSLARIKSTSHRRSLSLEVMSSSRLDYCQSISLTLKKAYDVCRL